MTQKSHPSARIVLHENDAIGQIRVDLDAFVEFQLRLGRDLKSLVANWAHVAAPNASRSAGKRKATQRR